MIEEIPTVYVGAPRLHYHRGNHGIGRFWFTEEMCIAFNDDYAVVEIDIAPEQVGGMEGLTERVGFQRSELTTHEEPDLQWLELQILANGEMPLVGCTAKNYKTFYEKHLYSPSIIQWGFKSV